MRSLKIYTILPATKTRSRKHFFTCHGKRDDHGFRYGSMSVNSKILIICLMFTACEQTDRTSGETENDTGFEAIILTGKSRVLPDTAESGFGNIHGSRSVAPTVTLEELEQSLEMLPELTSFMLYRDGDIISEFYYNGGASDRPSNIKSASKSIISALTGIAIQEGFIGSIDDPVAEYLPAYFDGLDDPDSLKHSITIRHLLTMSSGLRSTSFRNYGAWVTSRDWVGHAIRGPQLYPPGTRMSYSTGDSHILSAVLTRASGMSTMQLAERYLFSPMDVRIGGWDRDPQGFYFGGNNMALSPSGLLEFGKLYMNNGIHNGRQILDPDWVSQTLTTQHTRISFNNRGHDYGYLWWRNTFSGYDVWFAWGYGGQYIFLIPEINSIAVLTGNPDSRTRGMNNRIYTLLETVIIPFLAGTEHTHAQQSR
jgi:CubicO group peptidase (beta-lactamase class C family)